jgi:hypothetical protein
MSANTVCVPIDDIFYKPDLSLTTVRWVTETEETDEDGDIFISEKEMFDVVGEQHRLESVEAAAQAIAEESTFLPARFWLICDNDNEHDDQAVGVHAIVGQYAYHVGFLPRTSARRYRKAMESIDLQDLTLEVLGCIARGKTAPHPNARLYLPINFADLVLDGYTTDPANQVHWLQDGSAVHPRPWQGRDAQGFTDDELCKIFCWYAKKKLWNSLPNRCEAAAAEFRTCRGRVPEPMDSFVLEPEPMPEPARPASLRDFLPDAKNFAKKLIREHLATVMPADAVEDYMKGTSIVGPGGGPDGNTATLRWTRMRPMAQLGKITLTCTGHGPDEFRVDEVQFRPI